MGSTEPPGPPRPRTWVGGKTGDAADLVDCGRGSWRSDLRSTSLVGLVLGVPGRGSTRRQDGGPVTHRGPCLPTS